MGARAIGASPAPRIKDVARAANVSTATVSYVLNNTRPISREVRDRVLAAIEQLGYRRNSAARQLALGQSHTLGIVVSDIRNPFFPEIIAEFQSLALNRGLDVLVTNTNYDPERTGVTVNRLLSAQVSGIAVMTSQIDPAIIDLLAKRRVPTVYLDLGRVGRYTSNIVIEYAAGVRDAIEHLASLGHRRIGFIGGPVHLNSSARRKAAVLAVASQIPSVTLAAVDSDLTVAGGSQACAELLDAFSPQAIFCANDQMAIGALHCAFDRGIEIPGRLSVIGFDDITFAQYMHPALTTVSVPRHEIGRIALEAIIDMRGDPHHNGREYVVTPALILRETCCRACSKPRRIAGAKETAAGLRRPLRAQSKAPEQP